MIIRTKLTPTLTGRPPPNETERDLLTNPTHATDTEYSSIKITDALKEAILQQDFQYTGEVVAHQLEAKMEAHKLRREQARQTSEELRVSLHHSLKQFMDLIQEKGASSWLTSLPIEKIYFALHKGAFHDALALRYNWQPLHTPSTWMWCQVLRGARSLSQ
jgi:hypothetical protein